MVRLGLTTDHRDKVKLCLDQYSLRQAVLQEFVAVGEEFFQRQFACFDIGQDCFLGDVLLVDDASFGLLHAPRLAPFDAEHDQLARECAVLGFAVLFPLDEDAKVGNEGAVSGS